MERIFESHYGTTQYHSVGLDATPLVTSREEEGLKEASSDGRMWKTIKDIFSDVSLIKSSHLEQEDGVEFPMLNKAWHYVIPRRPRLKCGHYQV